MIALVLPAPLMAVLALLAGILILVGRSSYFFKKREPKTRNAKTTTSIAIPSRITLVAEANDGAAPTSWPVASKKFSARTTGTAASAVMP
jgi:hypothetical protein